MKEGASIVPARWAEHFEQVSDEKGAVFFRDKDGGGNRYTKLPSGDFVRL